MGNMIMKNVKIPERLLSLNGDRTYNLVKQLGRGGFGQVHLVEIEGDQEFEGFRQSVKHAVVKLPRFDLPDEKIEGQKHSPLDSAFNSIFHEYKQYKKFQQPGIARLLDGGIKKSNNPRYRNLPFLILELLFDHPFDFPWKNSPGNSQPRDLPTAINTYVYMADVLKNADLVYRDLNRKSIRVKVDAEYRELSEDDLVRIIAHHAIEPTLIDPGFAQSIREARRPNTQIVGVPENLAPEVFEKGKYSQKSDHYSLGCIIYSYVTGQAPFAHILKKYKFSDQYVRAKFIYHLIQEGKSPIHLGTLADAIKNQTSDPAAFNDFREFFEMTMHKNVRRRATYEMGLNFCKKRFKCDDRVLTESDIFYFDQVRGFWTPQTRFDVVDYQKDKNRFQTKRITRKRKGPRDSNRWSTASIETTKMELEQLTGGYKKIAENGSE